VHLHGAGELNGSGQVGTGLLPPSFLALQGAEVKVAMRLKWAHDELLGQGLAVVSFGCLDSVEEIQTLFCHRARGSAPPEQPSVRRAGPAGGHAPPCVLGHAQPSHG